MKIQRNLQEAANAIEFFVTRNFTFRVEKFDKLTRSLKNEDLKDFDLRQYETFSEVFISRLWAYGIRRYLMNLKDENLEDDRKYYRKVTRIFFVLKSLIIAGVIYAVFRRFKEVVWN